MPKLTDRQPVEGTTPTIYIGHRLDRNPDGIEKASKTWWAEYCLDSKQQYESLKTSNKKEAIGNAFKIVSRLERNEPAAAKRKVALPELVKRYMEDQTNKDRAPKTIQKYQHILDELVQFSEDHGIGAANNFVPKYFWSFNKHMADQKLSPTTRYGRMLIIKQFFKWAVKDKALPMSPIEGETVKEPQKNRQPCFDPQQIATLLDKADRYERPLFTMMAFTGMRVGEVRQLRWSDLILPKQGGGTINVECGGSVTGTTKGKRSRQIPIHPTLRQVLDGLPRKFSTVFTARPSRKYPDGGNPISERRLLLSLKRLCKRCGFADPDQYKLHTFRHTFASMLAMKGVATAYSLNLMGHKDSDVLNVYVKLFDAESKNAIDAIDYSLPGATDAPAA